MREAARTRPVLSNDPVDKLRFDRVHHEIRRSSDVVPIWEDRDTRPTCVRLGYIVKSEVWTKSKTELTAYIRLKLLEVLWSVTDVYPMTIPLMSHAITDNKKHARTNLFHPAFDIRSAYSRPMSPIPMIPMTGCSSSGSVGTTSTRMPLYVLVIFGVLLYRGGEEELHERRGGMCAYLLSDGQGRELAKVWPHPRNLR